MRTIPVVPSESAVPQEHAILCRVYGAAQQRCSRVMAEQQAHIERLEGEVLRLRAALVVRDTALAMTREDAQAAVVEQGTRRSPALGLFAAAAAVGFFRALRATAPRWKSMPLMRQPVQSPRTSRTPLPNHTSQGGMAHGPTKPKPYCLPVSGPAA